MTNRDHTPSISQNDGGDAKLRTEGSGGRPHLHHDAASRPLESPRLRVLSLGAGVQSTTLALLAARGDLGAMPDCAIFADTGAEPRSVYRHLDWLEGELPFPVHRVTAGNLRDQLLSPTAKKNGRPPMFIVGQFGKVGLTNRQCTQDFKIIPIMREVRRLLGLKPGSRGPKLPVVEQWIGISTDEIGRLKRSRHSYIHMRHPLIEARMSRRDCLRWLAERQYPEPPKSACTFCPFHSDAMWLEMKTNDPESFAEAVSVDEAIRSGSIVLKGVPYLHRTCKPLSEIAFSDQSGERQIFGFENECDGMCGV